VKYVIAGKEEAAEKVATLAIQIEDGCACITAVVDGRKQWLLKLTKDGKLSLYQAISKAFGFQTDDDGKIQIEG